MGSNRPTADQRNEETAAAFHPKTRHAHFPVPAAAFDSKPSQASNDLGASAISRADNRPKSCRHRPRKRFSQACCPEWFVRLLRGVRAPGKGSANDFFASR